VTRSFAVVLCDHEQRIRKAQNCVNTIFFGKANAGFFWGLKSKRPGETPGRLAFWWLANLRA